MLWISPFIGRSSLEQQAFHGNDKLRSNTHGRPTSCHSSWIPNRYLHLITSFWSFIHSLFVLIIWALKRVIITGGTGGLGKAISKRFKTAGFEVVALGRKDLDLTDESAIHAFFLKNDCDLLICAAGIVNDQPLARMSESTWDEVMELNYLAAKKCVLAVIPSMIRNGKGHIVFISSYAANHPAVGQAAYATAKASLLGFTRDLASLYGSNNIRVNAILPGFMETPMTENVSKKRLDQVRELHALGEWNTPEIVADFILFLEERMRYTSGQFFQLDSRAAF